MRRAKGSRPGWSSNSNRLALKTPVPLTEIRRASPAFQVPQSSLLAGRSDSRPNRHRSIARGLDVRHGCSVAVQVASGSAIQSLWRVDVADFLPAAVPFVNGLAAVALFGREVPPLISLALVLDDQLEAASGCSSSHSRSELRARSGDRAVVLQDPSIDLTRERACLISIDTCRAAPRVAFERRKMLLQFPPLPDRRGCIRCSHAGSVPNRPRTPPDPKQPCRARLTVSHGPDGCRVDRRRTRQGSGGGRFWAGRSPNRRSPSGCPRTVHDHPEPLADESSTQFVANESPSWVVTGPASPIETIRPWILMGGRKRCMVPIGATDTASAATPPQPDRRLIPAIKARSRLRVRVPDQPLERSNRLRHPERRR